MTKSDLEQLTLLNSEISRDLERLQELYALLTGCTSSISGLPHIGLLRGSDRTDKFVSMIDVLEQQIKAETERLRKLEQAAEKKRQQVVANSRSPRASNHSFALHRWPALAAGC